MADGSKERRDAPPSTRDSVGLDRRGQAAQLEIHVASAPRRLGASDYSGYSVDSDYSYLSASIGSTRDARSAGINPAANATSASVTVALASTSGSCPFI